MTLRKFETDLTRLIFPPLLFLSLYLIKRNSSTNVKIFPRRSRSSSSRPSLSSLSFPKDETLLVSRAVRNSQTPSLKSTQKIRYPEKSENEIRKMKETRRRLAMLNVQIAKDRRLKRIFALGPAIIGHTEFSSYRHNFKMVISHTLMIIIIYILLLEGGSLDESSLRSCIPRSWPAMRNKGSFLLKGKVGRSFEPESIYTRRGKGRKFSVRLI